MHIDYKQLAKLFGSSYSDVGRIILKYGELKQRLDSSDKRGWYFKSGIENTEKKLAELNAHYEKIQRDFEQYSLEELVEMLIQKKAEINAQPKIEGRLLNEILAASNQSNLNYLEELITLKKRVSTMMRIEHYISQVDDLKQLLGYGD